MDYHKNCLFESILNSIDVHAVVIDRTGQIVYVNQSWKTFGEKHGIPKNHDWTGINYLSVCQSSAHSGDTSAIKVVESISEALFSKIDALPIEYPFNTPNEKYWFVMRIVPLLDTDELFLISHQNITENKESQQYAERLSIEDPLTEIYNRRGMDIMAREEYSRAKRFQYPVGVLFIDIDKFKTLNDHQGHLAGDQCLKKIAIILKKHARRPGDLAVRIGGDEFILFLSNADEKLSLSVAEVIRKEVQDLKIALIDSSKKFVSVSIGVTSFIPKKQDQYSNEILLNADKAMYLSKNKRNSVFLSDIH